MLLLFGLAYILTGPTPESAPTPVGTEVQIDKPKANKKEDRLQLYTFTAATITPPADSLCKKGEDNTNPDLIIAHSPAHGTAVRKDGQIKIWTNDTAPLKIAPNEKIVRSSGQIATPGDRTARAPDGYLWEPALYIFPNTVDAGGRAFFPTFIRGSYDNGEVKVSYGSDQVPPAVIYKDKGRSAQIIWNVQDLGLVPGSYQLQFVVHDGNAGRAISCIAIRVYDFPDPKTEIPD